jgi:hypothetical protein
MTEMFWFAGGMGERKALKEGVVPTMQSPEGLAPHCTQPLDLNTYPLTLAPAPLALTLTRPLRWRSRLE